MMHIPYRFSAIIAVLFIFLSGMVCGCSDNDVQAPPSLSQNKAVNVSVITVEPASVKDVLVLPGEAEAFQDVRLAADKNGLVEWIDPTEGREVVADQLLAKIDVSALKAALDSAEASFKLSDSFYQRRKQLFERGASAKEELDRSITERTLALSNLRKARVEYERGFLRSPINGLVNKIHVDVGEYVDRGTPVIDLVNVVKIKINVNVPEIDVYYFNVGEKAMVTIDALPGRSMTGTIDFVAYKADPVTKTFQVRVVIFNQGRDIRPGMIARVAFLRRVIPDALVVPLSSLVDKGGERVVFVEKNGIAHARTVSIGIIKEDRVQITGGLEAGDHLIVVGQTEVEEGIKVQIQ